jgi:hypothetical protein
MLRLPLLQCSGPKSVGPWNILLHKEDSLRGNSAVGLPESAGPWNILLYKDGSLYKGPRVSGPQGRFSQRGKECGALDHTPPQGRLNTSTRKIHLNVTLHNEGSLRGNSAVGSSMSDLVTYSYTRKVHSKLTLKWARECPACPRT